MGAIGQHRIDHARKVGLRIGQFGQPARPFAPVTDFEAFFLRNPAAERPGNVLLMAGQSWSTNPDSI